ARDIRFAGGYRRGLLFPEVFMTRWMVVAGLVVLNILLGVGVFTHRMERSAQAQAAGIGGVRPEIAAVAGVNNGASIIYMLDVNSGVLVAQRVDVANSRIETLGRRNVAQDLARVGP